LQGFCHPLNYKRRVAENLNILTVQMLRTSPWRRAGIVSAQTYGPVRAAHSTGGAWPWAKVLCFFFMVYKTSVCVFVARFCYYSPSQHLAELSLACHIVLASKVSAGTKAAFF
jgi:hypothetical protein